MSRFGTFSVESYGQLPGGEVVWLVRLRADSGLQAEVLTLGATLHGVYARRMRAQWTLCWESCLWRGICRMDSAIPA